jgi:glutamyl/glutaminyl-tRNA synthetase
MGLILKIEGIPLSTSKMYDGIQRGEYSGWDDIRLGTLKALKKRGIKSESIREFMLKFGLSQRDITVPVDDLYKINKRLIDKEAIRLFSVFNPIKIIVKGCPKTICKHKLYVDKEKYNEIEIKEGINEFYIEKEELTDEMRLKDLFNIKRIKDNVFEFNGFEIKKSLSKVVWLLDGCFKEYVLVDKENMEKKIYVEDVIFDEYAQLERKFYVHKIGNKLYYCHD